MEQRETEKKEKKKFGFVPLWRHSFLITVPCTEGRQARLASDKVCCVVERQARQNRPRLEVTQGGGEDVAHRGLIV